MLLSQIQQATLLSKHDRVSVPPVLCNMHPVPGNLVKASQVLTICGINTGSWVKWCNLNGELMKVQGCSGEADGGFCLFQDD